MPDQDFCVRIRALCPAVAVRGDPDYDAILPHLSWNQRLATARRPAAVVPVSTAEEVSAAVRAARHSGRRISPRGGGHNYQAAALRDDVVLLDLAGLDRVEIDRSTRRAQVGAGVRGGDLLERLSAEGFAFPVGHCADVPLSGYILSGGFGWNSGRWGPASASVEAVDLVLADGSIVRASPGEHPDLFWAARGAGAGFFAVVTGYELRLHDLPQATHSINAAWNADSVPVLADWLTEAVRAAADGSEITILVGPHHATGEPAISLHAAATADSARRAREMIDPLAHPPATALQIDAVAREDIAFAALTKLSAMPGGKRVAADHAWCDGAVGDLLVALQPLAGVPTKMSSINIFALGGNGAYALPPDAHGSALSRGGATGVGIYALWDDPDDDERLQQWVRDVDVALAGFRTGRYVGEADLTAAPGRRAECFTPDALARLDELREAYDPEGVFARWP